MKKKLQAKQPVRKFLPWLICGIAALFYCYEYFLRISPSVMTAELMTSFSIGAAGLGTLSAFYYYAYTPLQLPVGLLMDRYGPRLLLTIACLVCSVGAYMFAYTSDFWIASIGRFLIGFGSAFAFVGVLKLATVWFPPNKFALVSGLATSLGMIGAMIGDVSLTSLVKDFGWRSTLEMSAHAGVIVSALIFFFVRSHKPANALHIYEDIKEQTNMKKLLISFVNVLKHPQIWIIGLIGAFLYLSLSVLAELWGILYLQEAHHFSAEDAATAISVVFLGWAIGGPLNGWISDKIKRRLTPIIVGSLVSSIMICIVLYVPHLSKPTIFGLLFLYGLFSSSQIIVFALAKENSPVMLSGTALAATNMLVMLGGVIFQPLVGYLLDLNWSGKLKHGVRDFATSDYQTALVLLPIFLLITFALTFFLKETHGKNVYHEKHIAS